MELFQKVADTKSSQTGSSVYSLEELRSQLPSNSAASSARARSSATTSEVSSDGVYMQGYNASGESQGSDDDTASISTSSVSRSHAASVTSTLSAGTTSTRELWSNIEGRSGTGTSTSGNIGRANTTTSGEKFATNKAVKPTAFERAQRRVTREQQQRQTQVEEEETVGEDDSDDEDDDGFQPY